MLKNFLCYVLVDPRTNTPRYVGITTRTLKIRLAGHMKELNKVPEVNPHKNAWIRQLLKYNLKPEIVLVKECSNLKELKRLEVEYISEHKEEYKLTNQTKGGDYVSEYAYSRETILKKKNTRAITLYNILGEKIADFAITEDIMRTYNLRPKACSHITLCCKGTRAHAYGYIWRYKEDPLGSIDNIDPRNIAFNKIIQYDLKGNRLNEFSTYIEVKKALNLKTYTGVMACCLGNQLTCNNYIFKLEPAYIYFDKDLYENTINKYKGFINKLYMNKSIKVNCFDLNNKLLYTFNSFLEAERFIGIQGSRSRIKKCCKGDLASYKNYIWKYAQVDLKPV